MEGKCRSVQPSQNHSLTGKTQQFVHVMQRQHANTCGGILQLTEHQCVCPPLDSTPIIARKWDRTQESSLEGGGEGRWGGGITLT